MKKNSVLKTVALVGAMTATGAVATTTAHADTTSATAQQSANTADQQLSNLKSQQTANENQLAAQNEAQYNSAANSANSQITKLQDQLKSQQASQAAQDQPALESGTAKINSAASSATASENAAYSSAVASQSAANQKELANAAQHIVTPAQKAQQESAAKSAYDKSKADLDAQHSAKNNQIKADYDAAVKKATDEAKANQTTAEQRHTQEVQDATTAVNDAQNKVNNLTQLNNKKQTELNNAKNQLDQAKKNSNTNQTINNTSLQQMEMHPVITLGPKFTNPLKETDYNHNLEEDPSFSKADYQDNFLDFNRQDLADAIKMDPNSSNPFSRPAYSDQNGTFIDDTATTLAIWEANLLNQTRTQAKTPQVYTSQKVAQYGTKLMQILNNMIPDRGDDGLDDSVLAKAGQIFYQQYGIHVTFDSAGGGKPTITELQVNGQTKYAPEHMSIQNAIFNLACINSELLEQDSLPNEPHTRDLLGITPMTSALNNGSYAEYIAYNKDKQGFTHILHFFIPANQIDHSQDLDTSYTALAKLGNPNKNQSSSDSAKALQTAQTAYDNASTAAQQAANDLTRAKADLANAQTKLADLQKSQGTSATDQALQAKLNDLAKTRDAAMQKENNSYNTAMNKLNADYQAKLDAIKKLPTNVDELRAQQATRLADLKKAHDQKLADIQANEQKQIAALKDKLAHSHDAENQPLLDQIAKIKADLKTKEDNLNAALAELKAHDAAAYEQLKAKLFPTNNAEAAVKGNSNSYVANGSSIKVTFPVNNQTESTNVDSNTLPQTGNNNSAAVVALGAIASMLGLGMVAKKREY